MENKTSVGGFRYSFCAALLDVWHRNRKLGVRVTLAPSHIWFSDFSSWHNLARPICPCLPMGISTARTSARLCVLVLLPLYFPPCTNLCASAAKHCFNHQDKAVGFSGPFLVQRSSRQAGTNCMFLSFQKFLCSPQSFGMCVKNVLCLLQPDISPEPGDSDTHH